MTKLLEQAFVAAQKLPMAMQDEMARAILSMAGAGEAFIPLSAEEEASFDDSLAQAERGEFASDAQIRAIWAKHGL